MKAVVNAERFSEALKKAGAVLGKAVIPLLEQVRADFAGGVCRLTGTNLDHWLIAEIPAEGDSFSFVFSNTREIIRLCKYFSGALTLEVTGQAEDESRYKRNKGYLLEITCGEKGASFPVWDSEDYPVLGDPGELLYCYSVRPAELLRRVKRIGYAACPSKTRPQSIGVRFQDSRLWCVDGVRLAVNTDSNLTVDRPFVLSKLSLAHLKEFGGECADLRIYQKFAVFSGGGLSLYCRIILSSDAMELEKVVPKSFVSTYSVRRSSFLDALKYLNDCVRDRSKACVLCDRGKLYVLENDRMYRATVDIQGESFDRHAFRLTFLKEALEQFAGVEEITVHENNAAAPVLFTAGGADIALLLPVRAYKGWERIDAAA